MCFLEITMIRKGIEMKDLIKNLKKAEVLPLLDQVSYEKGKVASLTLAQQPGVGMTLFAFDAGEGVSTHSAPGDAMVQVLEGEARITIDGVENHLTAGQIIIMPAGVPHAVWAVTPFKMLLTVVKAD